jgi:hypothetical protein
MSIRDLFADDAPVPESKVRRPNFRPYQEGDYENLARVIMDKAPVPKRKPSKTEPIDKPVDKMEQYDPIDKMEQYDRELFESLFLRYGKAWINTEIRRLIRKFPSYKTG